MTFPERCWQAGLVVAGLLFVAAVGGLFLDAYAAETPFVRNANRGADVVSLAVTLPMLLLASRFARRGSARALLLRLGALAYVTYQYGCVFAYRWNRLFLVYLALLSISGFTVVRSLIARDPASLARRSDGTASLRAVARYLTVSAPLSDSWNCPRSCRSSLPATFPGS